MPVLRSDETPSREDRTHAIRGAAFLGRLPAEPEDGQPCITWERDPFKLGPLVA
jgi:hypothetical protein